jgi:hypothetical protein
MTATMNAPVLVLNGYTEQLLNRTTMAKAMKMLMKGKARIKHAYEFDIHHGLGERAAPVVIEMLYYVAVRPHHGRVSVTKKNVLFRDKHVCQYCGKKIRKYPTVDHVQPRNPSDPRAPKGQDTWLNLVASCQPCNQRKANRTPQEAGMRLINQPYEPTRIEWETILAHTKPGEWTKYLTTYHKTVKYDQDPV